ncbi:efflux RND transporter periplasmic adaptor subunit [Sphingomonas bacterium]|uniref:efflux RND transporter periplasmic adaptor subunit n=1 Tax=Sphingomonas bacterium TaxID=1895847 RepID=UPI001576D1E8|nr:efflux RND transporter periplasmic adaptor subunit [Sphingomonas bacterium]
MVFGVHGRSVALALALLAAGCGGGADKKKGGAGGRGGDAGPPEVGYVVVQPTDATQVTTLSGRTAAYESSDVRPQVGGIVKARLFTEGTLVHAGQPLYQVDASLYRAAANQASANLQAAQATAEASRIQADRYAPLAKIEAVSKQEYTNAIATARQNRAQVAQGRAALDTARINLKFTTVPAPITGRIGRSLFTVGALVSPSQTDPLAQIQRLNPIFVDIQRSASDLLALRRQLSSGGASPTRAVVRLTLEDGSDYGQTGTVEFSEALVSLETGTVTLRARFPNAQSLLLPGMFVRARFETAVQHHVFLVPQQAVNRGPKGDATVYVVTPDNHAVQRTVTADRVQGADWVVTAGLKPGDKIVTQGLGKLQQAASGGGAGGGKQGDKAKGGGEAKGGDKGGQGKGDSQGGGGGQGGGAGIAVRPVPANAAERLQPPKDAGKKQTHGQGGGG